MTTNATLPDEDVWQPDGHVSDVAITVLADGERALLPNAATLHVDACDHCTARLGEQALLSVSLGDALRAAPAARFPVAALVIALIVAGLGVMPALLEMPRWLSALPSTLLQGVPVAFRAGLALLKIASTGSVPIVVVSLVAAVVLCAIGLSIAKLAPREMAWKGIQK